MWTPDPSIIITAEQKAADVQAALIEQFRAAVQAHVDATAQSKRYDSGSTLDGYVTSTNPQWAAEAQAFVPWRDRVWAYVYAQEDKVLNGLRPLPTVEELLRELPPMVWPA